MFNPNNIHLFTENVRLSVTEDSLVMESLSPDEQYPTDEAVTINFIVPNHMIDDLTPIMLAAMSAELFPTLRPFNGWQVQGEHVTQYRVRAILESLIVPKGEAN